jgi:hypothetical protein
MTIDEIKNNMIKNGSLSKSINTMKTGSHSRGELSSIHHEEMTFIKKC